MWTECNYDCRLRIPISNILKNDCTNGKIKVIISEVSKWDYFVIKTVLNKSKAKIDSKPPGLLYKELNHCYIFQI